MQEHLHFSQREHTPMNNPKYLRRVILTERLRLRVAESFRNPLTGILLDPVTSMSPSFDKQNRLVIAKFSFSRDIRLDEILRLSAALGTEAINFNFGEDGEPALSEVTPGIDGSAGWVEVYFENGWNPTITGGA